MSTNQTVVENSSPEFKYFIFISYRRLDADWKAGVYFQRQLEKFRYPVSQVDESWRPSHPKYVRSVFRDRRNLKNTGNSFTEDIKQALTDSRYLLVLCSPNSAASPWVNDEIEYFLETHNHDLSLVIPVVLSGEPHLEGETCLPPALRLEAITSRNLPSMIPDPGDSEKTGWEAGLVQSLSYILHVDRERIKRSIDEEERRRRNVILSIISTALVICLCLTAWALYAENVAVKQRNRAEIAEKEANVQKKEALVQRDKAIEQANIANKTLEFMEGIFLRSDPLRGGNKDLKVLDAIKSVIPSIRTLAPWQLKASVSLTAGNIMSSLSEPKEGIPLIKDALEMYEEHPSEYSDRIVVCNDVLSNVYCSSGQNKEALERANKVLNNMLALKTGANADEIARIYNNIGLIYYGMGEYLKAVEYYQRAIKDDVISPVDMMTYNNIGCAYMQLGNYDMADKNIKNALTLRITFLGEENVLTLTTYDNLAHLYQMQGNILEALDLSLKTLPLKIKSVGKNHSMIALSYNNIATIYSDLEKYDKAIDFQNKAIQIYNTIYGENNPYSALGYANIGQLYANLLKNEQALEYCKKSLEIRSSLNDKNYTQIAQSKALIGYIYTEMDELELAEKYLKEAESIYQKYGSEFEGETSLYMYFGKLYALQEKYDKAELKYREALTRYKKVNRLKGTFECLCVLGEIKVNTKLYDQALEYYQEAARMFDGSPSEHKIELNRLEYLLGDMYTVMENYSEAKIHLDKNLKFVKKTYGERSSEFADTLVTYIIHMPFYELTIDEFHQYFEKMELVFDIYSEKEEENSEKLLHAKIISIAMKEVYLEVLDQKIAEADSQNTNNTSESARYYFEKGKTLEDLGLEEKIQDIEDCFRSALKILQKDPAQKNSVLLADTYHQIALIKMTNLANAKVAKDYFLKELEIRQFLSDGKEDDYSISIYKNLCGVSFLLSDNDEADRYFEQAESACKQLHGYYSPEMEDLHSDGCVIYNALFTVQQIDSQQLLNLFNKLLDIHIHLYTENSQQTCESMSSIALVYMQLNDFQLALEHFQKALNIQLKIHGENHPEVATCYNNIGKAYYGLKEYEKAELNLRKAIEIVDSKDDDKVGAARYHFNLGLVLFEVEKFDEAMTEYKKAEALYREVDVKLLDSPQGLELMEGKKACLDRIQKKQNNNTEQ